MRVEVISDIHGRFDFLARALERAEQLIILGDLLDYANYQEPDNCILGHLTWLTGRDISGGYRADLR